MEVNIQPPTNHKLKIHSLSILDKIHIRIKLQVIKLTLVPHNKMLIRIILIQCSTHLAVSELVIQFPLQIMQDKTHNKTNRTNSHSDIL
jgi:hypothetical protein